MQTITIRQILDYLESGQAFSLKVVSYDRKRKQGGAVVEYPEAVLHRSGEKSEARGRRSDTTDQVKGTRRPNHGHWYTRNIRLLQNGHPTSIIRKIHPPLIIEFNQQPVVP